MRIKVDQRGSSKVAIVESDSIVIGDVQDALDLLASVQYNEGCEKILIPKSNVAEAFFDLSTRLAGEILQKFATYQTKLAIVGDFGGYGSKSLKDFIYESNQGKNAFFLPDEESALDALHRLP
ncbi:hypothetical protein J19TS2_36980 [Cohnella xylanilytica]|uniref:DUF4180 domain-containing protein n=1 Tax=Cohnella xylanilytica TaxID=557555 RepID=A0A841U717_9BACL|nr:DUF4180 domain-containing protein [Cohnella xylanilytica]MBB6693811.1 DUF4180 domain-containing protein [Cohnella xylanilytica]GIO14143.1 hypothetical protein J19TS2_36980 [Cohnella xylanilytica]